MITLLLAGSLKRCFQLDNEGTRYVDNNVNAA
jgi:hypothetical protein